MLSQNVTFPLNSRIMCSEPDKRSRGSHVSSLGSGKPRHPMRNSRLLCLVRRLSFTTSTKYCGLSLLDASNMFTLVCITVDFATVELSPTHCPHTDVDVSLKGFPPASSQEVLTILPLPASFSSFGRRKKISQIASKMKAKSAFLGAVRSAGEIPFDCW